MKTIVIGVIGSDCHAVGNKILNHVFTKEGFNVINIGVLSPQEDFINAAIETKADAILVSSLYGHGEIDCRGLRQKCDESGLKGILLYVGGNLVVGKQNWDETRTKFIKMGFDRVYPPGSDPMLGVADLKKDLNIEES
ncbi:MAG: methylaspartate mutase subunit S [Bacillota bacterium]|nr:methylaspartate mutase subunit S [Bacillota bacterium]